MRWYECDGLTENPACEVLYAYAESVPSTCAIVEVGVFRGKSLLAIAEGSLSGNQAQVHGVDPWNRVRPSKAKYVSDETFTYVRKAVHDSPASDLIFLHKKFGIEAASQWSGPRVGMLYIDADHRKDPVIADFMSWRPHLAPGAIIAFDDHDVATFPGVVEAVSALKDWGLIRDVRIPAGCSRLAVAEYTG